MGVGKVPAETEGSCRWVQEGNHDNPVSRNHQAPSHWEPQWRNAQILTKTHPKGKKSWEQKSATATTQESNVSEIIDQQKCCKIC